MRGVYLQVNGLAVDALVVSSNPCCLILDFTLHILEVRELATWNVMEFCPFALRFDAGGRMGYVNIIAFRCVVFAWNVY